MGCWLKVRALVVPLRAIHVTSSRIVAEASRGPAQTDKGPQSAVALRGPGVREPFPFRVLRGGNGNEPAVTVADEVSCVVQSSQGVCEAFISDAQRGA